MNPIAVIVLTALGIIGGAGLANLPPDTDLPPIVADSWGDTPAEASQTLYNAPQTTQPSRRGICPPVYDTALLVGFTPDQAALLDEIAYLESRCQPDARGDLNDGVSHGILQIHGPSWCEPSRYWPDGYLQTKMIVETCDDLYDPEIAVLAARLIFVEGGFEQWSTYAKAVAP